MNKELVSVCDTNKKAWCKPVARAVELETAEILAASQRTTRTSLQSMDEEDWYIEEENGGGNEDGGEGNIF